MAADPSTLDIVEAGHQLRAKTLTAEALTEACLANVATRNDELRAFITVTAEAARAAARLADRELDIGHDRGPLHGIPIALKDLIDQAGVPTTAASHVRPLTPASGDAIVTARLKAAGAVLIGKTNLHEFALGTTSEDSAFGAVRNPLDTTRSAGGSSGGSAAAIVAGMALGGWMSGKIYDFTGSYQAALLNGIAFNMMNILIAAWLLYRLTGSRRRIAATPA